MRLSASYTVAIIAIAVILVAAIKPGLDRRASFDVLVERTKIQGFVIRGAELGKFVQTGGTTTHVVEENGVAVARMNATRPAHDGMPTPGVVYLLPAQLAKVFSKGGARVTVRTRGAPVPNRSSGFRAAFTLEGSGWSTSSPTFDANGHFTEYAFFIDSFDEAPV
ncbi:MAG: hypothetical protein MI723_04575, partial [Caulobacterales bacterium]|nr:hypothetical protein [Caulobacterales bacterium]